MAIDCELRRHPDSPSGAVRRIGVEIRRTGALLALRYRVSGTIPGITMPATAAALRADELWKHTCCEAFLADGGGPYWEFNFSPSTQWAAYAFDGYRSGMRPAVADAPEIATACHSGGFDLRATLALDKIQNFKPLAGLRCGLSAVIEETSGRKSYWALAHSPGKPDFHRPDCFALELPPASAG